MAAGKITKTEWSLLGLTALFLCVLLTLFYRDRAEVAASAVETVKQAEVSVESAAQPNEGAPTGNAAEPAVETEQETEGTQQERLDLNTASTEELMTLPGIGEKLAARIVEYRETNGRFDRIEELMEVSGIGEKRFAAVEDLVTVK